MTFIDASPEPTPMPTPTPKPTRSRSALAVVAIGASAGGLPAICRILSMLPRDFPVPILIVQHLAPLFPSTMDQVMDRHAKMRVRWAEPGDTLEAGTAYLAARDLHLTVDGGGVLALPNTVQVRSSRPSADILFNSVAVSFGARAIAVVLTGTGFDGGDGAGAVRRAGGSVIVQDEETSQYFSMPRAAIVATTSRHVLPIDRIAPMLVALAQRGALA